VSVWLDSESLKSGGLLAQLLHRVLAKSLRAGGVFTIATAALGWRHWRERVIALEAPTFDWKVPLFVHSAVLAFFCLLSWYVFSARRQSDALLTLWICAGVATLGSICLTLLPAGHWSRLLRGNRDLYIVSAVIGALAVSAGVLTQVYWKATGPVTLRAVEWVLRPVLSGVKVNPAIAEIGSPAFGVTIAPQCSGYEGIGMILVFGSAWLWFFRKAYRFPQALVLLPAGMACMWSLNILRIATLILIGSSGFPSIAEGGFHSQAGWIAFVATAALLAGASERVAWFHSTPRVAAATYNPAIGYLAPFLAILAASLIAGAFAAGGFERLYWLRPVAGIGTFLLVRRLGIPIRWRPGWAGFALGIPVLGLWLFLAPHGESNGFVSSLHALGPVERALWLTTRIVSAVLVVPVAEELAFRGFGMRRLINERFEWVDWQKFTWLSLVISSIAFGLLHGRMWLAGSLAGLVFAYAQLRRGSLGDAIAAHAVANAGLAVWVLYTGQYYLW
jgi:exosortase E/protease (VPEID-CTERM system)